ncbi:MAG: HTH domain-containing protein [Acinetobacter sp.]
MSGEKTEFFGDMLSIVSFAQFNPITSAWVSAYLSVSRRTVQRYIKNLIDGGYLEETSRGVVATSKAFRMITTGGAQG